MLVVPNVGATSWKGPGWAFDRYSNSQRQAPSEGCARFDRLQLLGIAVGAGDREMLFDPLALQPLPRHARSRRADLVLSLEFDPLCFRTAVIDLGINVEFGKGCGCGCAACRRC